MRGAVSFQVKGVDYSMSLTTNAICKIEERTGKSFKDFMDWSTERPVTAMRLFVWATFSTPLSMDAAGDMIDEIGDEKANELILEVVKAAFPAMDVSAEGNGATAG